jgi:hypothetical protein
VDLRGLLAAQPAAETEQRNRQSNRRDGHSREVDRARAYDAWYETALGPVSALRSPPGTGQRPATIIAVIPMP